MHRGWRAAVIAAALGVGGAASAHEFKCEKRVNGQLVVELNDYPAKLKFTYRITNLHPTTESVADTAQDTVLDQYGFRFKHKLPLAVPVGGAADTEFKLHIGSYEECQQLAAQDGAADKYLDSLFRVTWALGQDQCATRVVCQEQYVPPEEVPCDVGCPELIPSREEGFFKVHEQMLTQCLAYGPIELGPLGTVTTLEEALGVLWGSAALHRNGQPRAELDAVRLLLGRQLLVATCNGLFFNTPPANLAAAWNALNGRNCERISDFIEEVQDYNAFGRTLPLTIDSGPATPVHAQSIAHDFTQPSGQSCQ